jgi:hypothetical protein
MKSETTTDIDPPPKEPRAPTAGACAALPGAVIALAETMSLGEEDMAKAMLAGGLIGAFIAARKAAGCGSSCGCEGASASRYNSIRHEPTRLLWRRACGQFGVGASRAGG